MSVWTRLREWVRRDRVSRRLGEADAPADPGVAWSRETGGVPNPDAPDRHSTTGTTPSGEFVGRASGDEAGDTQPTGAEVRAEAQRKRDGPEGRDG